MITILVGNTKCKLVGLKDPAVHKAIDMQLSYAVEGFQFMRVKNNWDGRYRLLTHNNYFPVGMLPTVERVLSLHHCAYEVKDHRDKPEYGIPMGLDPSSGFVPRDYQLEVVEAAWQRGGGIVRAATGCHAAGTEILMFDGTIKRVEDIQVGDRVMGPDSRPRNVLRLCRGKDRMVKIIPTKGESFIINQEHILSLKRTKKRVNDSLAGDIVDIKFSDWERGSKTYKHIHKLFKVPIYFSKKEQVIDPYFLGILLGDGSLKHSVGVTSIDNETIDLVYKKAEQYNLNVRKSKITYFLSAKQNKKGANELRNQLKKLGLLGLDSSNKYIPHLYKVGSKEQRLQILAGLLDSDGYLSKSVYDFISKSEQLSKDVAFIARSLGLAAYIKKKRCVCTNNGQSGIYYRVSISGNTNIIPCKLERKKAPKRRQKKDVLVTGFSYKECGEGYYYGFQVDGDNRYLLGDFTVTHNSGKTLMIAMIAAKFNIKTVIYVIGIELLYQMKSTIERAYPGIKVGMVGDGHCDIQDITVSTIWSASAAFGKKTKLIDNDLTPDSSRKNKGLKKELVREMVMTAEMIIVDECQYAASDTVQFLHRNSKSARHRFLFSGTPWRDSGDDILIEAVGGPKIYDINATSLIEKGWLVRPKIYFLDVPVMKGVGKTYPDVYRNFIVDNHQRNELIIKATKRLVDRGRKTLILVTKVAHGERLLSLLENDLRVSSLDGRNKTSDRISAIEAMKDGELDVLIASKIFDQGIDIPNLDALVLAGSGKSSARALQRIGRVIRKSDKSKKDAIVVDFFDNCKYLRDHSHIRNKVYSTEPGFEIIMPKRG